MWRESKIRALGVASCSISLISGSQTAYFVAKKLPKCHRRDIFIWNLPQQCAWHQKRWRDGRWGKSPKLDYAMTPYPTHGMDVWLFCLCYSQGRPWEQRSGPACHPSWPGAACNSLLPGSFSWWHILTAAQDFRMGATDHSASEESRDVWGCCSGDKNNGGKSGAPSSSVAWAGRWLWPRLADEKACRNDSPQGHRNEPGFAYSWLNLYLAWDQIWALAGQIV